MADGREASQWNQTSHVLAAILNSAFGNDRAWSPRELNPFSEPIEEDEGPEISIEDAAAMFCGPEAYEFFKQADAKQNPEN